MVPGFNHNIKYKGEIYHVQTEDSGLDSPHIITLLYKGGTILAKEKISYSDIIKVDNLPAVVKELMEDQHKAILKKLLAGSFDDPAKSPPPSGKNNQTIVEDDSESIEDKTLFSKKDIDEFILDFLNTENDDDG